MVCGVPHLNAAGEAPKWEPEQRFADANMPKVEIYTSANCAYCVAAKNLLKHNGLDYAEVRIDTDAARRDEMVARTQRRSVPQVFIDGRHFGGYEELAAADRSGELAALGGSGA
jgi:glutaredoxin 3